MAVTDTETSDTTATGLVVAEEKVDEEDYHLQVEEVYWSHARGRGRGRLRGSVYENSEGKYVKFKSIDTDQEYKVGDYAYLESDRPDQPYFVGHIQEYVKGKRENLFITVRWFYRADDIPEVVYQLLVQNRNIENESGTDLIIKDPVIKNRELFISDITCTYPVSSLRGFCKVEHYEDIFNARRFVPSQDAFFYILGYNPETRRLANTQGEIRVGPSHQARLPEYKPNVKPNDMAERCQPLEELLWTPGLSVDCDLMIYLQAARSMAAFAGMCDGGSPDDGCLAACRDDTTINALDTLHESSYSTGKALQALVKNPVPSGIKQRWTEDEQKRFSKGLRQYGKNFFKIRKELIPHKETGELVQFYYLWKKTPAAANARPHRRHRRQNMRRIKTGTRAGNKPNNEYMDMSSASEEDNDSDDSDSKDMTGYACHHCFTTTSKDWHHAGKGRTLLCTECRIYYKKYGELRPLMQPREPPSFMFKPVKEEDNGMGGCNSTSSTPVNGKHGMRTRRYKENSNDPRNKLRPSRPGSAASPEYTTDGNTNSSTVGIGKLGRKSPSTSSTSSTSSNEKQDIKLVTKTVESDSPIKGKKRIREDGKSSPVSDIDLDETDSKDGTPVKKTKVKTEQQSRYGSPSESTTTNTEESGSISNDEDRSSSSSSSSSAESNPSSPSNVAINRPASPPVINDNDQDGMSNLENPLPLDLNVNVSTPPIIISNFQPLHQTPPPPIATSSASIDTADDDPVNTAPFLSRMTPKQEPSPINDLPPASEAASALKSNDRNVSPPPLLLPVLKTEPISPKPVPSSDGVSNMNGRSLMPPMLKVKEEPTSSGGHCGVAVPQSSLQVPYQPLRSPSVSVGTPLPSPASSILPVLSVANLTGQNQPPTLPRLVYPHNQIGSSIGNGGTLPSSIRTNDTKDTPVVPVAPSILRDNQQRVNEHGGGSSNVPPYLIGLHHQRQPPLQSTMPLHKPFHPSFLATSSSQQPPPTIKSEPQEIPPPPSSFVNSSANSVVPTSSFITLPSSTTRSSITKPIATVAASVNQQRNSSPAMMKPSSPHTGKSASIMITTCAPSSCSTLTSSTPSSASSPFTLHSFAPHVPLPPSYAHHGMPPSAIPGIHPFAAYPYHLTGYPAPHPSLHPPVPPRPPSGMMLSVGSSASSHVASSSSHHHQSSDSEPPKSHHHHHVQHHHSSSHHTSSKHSSSSVSSSVSSSSSGINISHHASSHHHHHRHHTSSSGMMMNMPPAGMSSSSSKDIRTPSSNHHHYHHHQKHEETVTVEDDDDEPVALMYQGPEPEPKIDNSECLRSQSAIFLKYWNRGDYNSCCRTDLIFKPVPDSKLARKREERHRRQVEREQQQKMPQKTPTPCKTPMSTDINKSRDNTPSAPQHHQQQQPTSSYDRNTPHRPGMIQDTPALRQLSEYARPHNAFSPTVPRSTPSSLSSIYPNIASISCLPGPSTGIIAPYGSIAGMDPVLQYQLPSGVYGPSARERLEMEFEREKREREFREREFRERELHEKLKAEMEMKNLPAGMVGRFQQGGGIPFGANPLDPHWLELQRRYAAAAGLSPVGPPNSMHQSPFGLYQHSPHAQASANIVERERLAAIQAGVPPSPELDRMAADRMAALAAAATNDPVLRLQLAAASAAGLTPTSNEMHSHAHTHAHAHTHLHLHPHEMTPTIPPYPPNNESPGGSNGPAGHPLLPPSAGSFPRPGFPMGRDSLLHVGGHPGMLRAPYEDQLAHQLSAQQEHLQRQLMLERERFPPPGGPLPPHLMIHHEEYLRQQQAREREMKMKLRTLEEAARGNRPFDGSMGGGSSGGAGGVLDRS